MARNSILFRVVCENKHRHIGAAQTQYLLRQQRWKNTAAAELKTMKDMPGLSTLPLIGSLHHFLPVIGKIGVKGNFFDLLSTFSKEYGTIVNISIFREMIILYEPEDYYKVHRAEENWPSRPTFDSMVYYRSKLRKSAYEGVYGLLTAQGAQWRDFRTKVNPALLMPKLVKLYTPAITEVATDMVQRLKKLTDDQNYIENSFHLEINKYALEAIAVVGLGARVGCLEDDLPEEHPARQLIKCAKDIIELSFKLEFSPSIWKWFPTPTFKKLIKAYDIQWSISELYIEQAKKKISEREHDIPEEDKSVIERLLAVDQKVAVIMANEMLLAGIDTVAIIIMGVLYHLANNLEKQNKLREEICSPDGKRPYLRACIKEALRIWPVLPGNSRKTTKEHIVQGYLIPKGVDVVSPNDILSKLEKYYPRPFEFIPERWIVDKSDPLYYGNAPPMVTRPFGIGVRACIGRRIAELEIEALITKIIEEFEVTWEGPPVKVVTKIMNQFQKPYSYKFRTLK